MDISVLRAWWAHRQGLDGRFAGRPAAEVLEQTGWARSVGGAGPYLTLFARAGLSRDAIDLAVTNLDICELPSARGCTYVVPASDFALGLKAGHGFNTETDMKLARKLGATDAELDRLCLKVLDAVAQGPKDPQEIRETVGGAVRNFGPEGVKKGMTTTLPVALGKLQAQGELRRIPANGRLDQQRYRYARWTPNPLAKLKLSQDEAQTELARRYFTWIGPATLVEFQWFSALGVKAAKAAIAPLGLAPLAAGDDRWMFPADRDALRSFKMPQKPVYALVSSLDGLTLLRRAFRELMTEEDLGSKIFTGKGYPPGSSLADLPSHGIFDRGRLIGLWEYDVPRQSVAWTAFTEPDSALRKAVCRMEEFVRTQLGDAKSFSLDSPKSRAPRVEALRKAAIG